MNELERYYINQPEETKAKLISIRNFILEMEPNANEVIRYGIPTLKISNKNLIHYAGFKNHIGFYPGAEAINVFKEHIQNYKTSKGTIQFPNENPIPFDLIKKIIEFRSKQIELE